MKRICIALAFMFCLGCLAGMGLSESLGADWFFDSSGLTLDDGLALSTISVSPSGRYIACADRTTIDIHARNAADVANPLGRLPDAIYLFEKGETGYEQCRVIPIDTDEMLELSSTIGGRCVFAWNEDESGAVIACDWRVGSDSLLQRMIMHGNMYLLDIESGSFTQLTADYESGTYNVLPVWEGDSAVRFLRTGRSRDNLIYNSLLEMDVRTGAETELCELFNDEGRANTVYSWKLAQDKVYYVFESMNPDFTSGLYASDLGSSAGDARCLVNVYAELIATGVHPYCRFAFYGFELSDDGKYACLWVNDHRVLARDIPLADDERFPQSDPANAVSSVYGKPWVPCHNVFLYDMEEKRLIDPFTNAGLLPDKAFVTGACFVDGGSALLCAVFGYGGEWTSADLRRTTFFKVSLDDFTAERLCELELSSSLWFPRGISVLEDGTVCVATDIPPLDPVQLFRISALQ